MDHPRQSELFALQRIRALRARRGLSRSALAARIGIHETTVRNWETGQNRPNPIATRILEELETSVDSDQTMPG